MHVRLCRVASHLVRRQALNFILPSCSPCLHYVSSPRESFSSAWGVYRPPAHKFLLAVCMRDTNRPSPPLPCRFSSPLSGRGSIARAFGGITLLKILERSDAPPGRLCLRQVTVHALSCKHACLISCMSPARLPVCPPHVLAEGPRPPSLCNLPLLSMCFVKKKKNMRTLATCRSLLNVTLKGTLHFPFPTPLI